jgi:hypothetical protein
LFYYTKYEGYNEINLELKYMSDEVENSDISKSKEKRDYSSFLQGVILFLVSMLVTGAAFYITFGYAVGKDISKIQANQAVLMKNMERNQEQLIRIREDFTNVKIFMAKEEFRFKEIEDSIKVAWNKIENLEESLYSEDQM